MELRLPTPSEREKRRRLNALLAEGLVTIHLNPRCEGVELPEHLMDQPSVSLNLSHRFALKTFEIGPLSIRAGLSFGGTRFLCQLPWSSIFGLVQEGQEPLLFPEEFPAELRYTGEKKF